MCEAGAQAALTHGADEHDPTSAIHARIVGSEMRDGITTAPNLEDEGAVAPRLSGPSQPDCPKNNIGIGLSGVTRHDRRWEARPPLWMGRMRRPRPGRPAWVKSGAPEEPIEIGRRRSTTTGGTVWRGWGYGPATG